MKKKWVFLAGMLSGVLLMIVLIVAIRYLPELMQGNETTEMTQDDRDSIMFAREEERRSLEEQLYGLTTFDEKSVKVIQVIQSIYNNQALVRGKDESGLYIGTLYLLENELPNTLYDEKIIKIPKGSVLRMSGLYRYITTDGGYKTVPKVRITEK